MFQDTRTRSGSDQSQDQNKDKREQQERQNREAQRKAEEITKETRERMANEAALRSYEMHQTINGRMEEMRAQERAGASAQAVAAKVEERVLPDVQHDVSKLNLPFNEDRRGELIANARRSIMERAKPVEAETEKVTKQRDDERKAEVKREERASRGESSLG